VSDITPTRSAVIELKDERRAMHEGYVFLDEKCLLLAAEMLRELATWNRLQSAFLAAHRKAQRALRSALAHHGLEELQVYPPLELDGAKIAIQPRSVMGVALQQAELVVPADATAGAAINPSPQAEACRGAWLEMLRQAAPLAACAGNLERLYTEYRRAMRRARALQDVLLPELERDVAEVETRLEELEQEDAIWMRAGVR
jgi:V/A-type H+-transporting ATPase subunit D